MGGAIYTFEDGRGNRLSVYPPTVERGIRIAASPVGCLLPDDEIPALISGLQNYMSRKARELSKAAKA